MGATHTPATVSGKSIGRRTCVVNNAADGVINDAAGDAAVVAIAGWAARVLEGGRRRIFERLLVVACSRHHHKSRGVSLHCRVAVLHLALRRRARARVFVHKHTADSACRAVFGTGYAAHDVVGRVDGLIFEAKAPRVSHR